MLAIDNTYKLSRDFVPLEDIYNNKMLSGLASMSEHFAVVFGA